MFAAIFAITLATTTTCGVAQAALTDAQSAWQAFKNGDFVEHAAEAEAQFRAAKRDVTASDKAAASCRGDRTAIARAELHFEFDLVDARRNRGSNASLALLRGDIERLQRLGLARNEPDRYLLDVNRFRELQAETRGRVVIPVPALPGTTAPSLPQRNFSCTSPDVPAHPLAPITPAAPDVRLLRRPHGATAVSVLVGAQGEILGTLTIASSGNAELDQAVTNAARLVAYAPARVNCKPVEGEYRFTYTFPQL
jgi:TonB family protein